MMNIGCSYHHHFGDCCSHCDKTTKIDEFYYLIDDEMMKKWLADGFLVLTQFIVYADFYNYRSGVYEQRSNNKRGAHAVAVIGFDDEQQYWIAKNSWGDGWGEHGFFKIKYDEVSFMNFGIVYTKEDLDDHDNHERIGANNIKSNKLLIFGFFFINYLVVQLPN